jgi:hypothetical protein
VGDCSDEQLGLLFARVIQLCKPTYHDKAESHTVWLMFLWRLHPMSADLLPFSNPVHDADALTGATVSNWVFHACAFFVCLQGYVIQMQAAKLGVVTRRHLAEHCR